MVTRTLVPGLMLMLLLSAQAGLPGLASAYCCPCSNPCMNGCTCRGTAPCSSCRVEGGSLFQRHAAAIMPSSEFSPAQGTLSALFALPIADLSGELVALARGGTRTIGDLTSRFMAGAEFRLKSWCPGSLDKRV
jgi:hypothetical protein